MLNGLDLFSGIGGLSIALNEWVKPIAYCEIDPYCRGILLSKMSTNELAKAPIWDDVRTFNGQGIEGAVELIYGGFPCQDISVAGHGKGLEGKRSGLFFEIMRLAKEIKPPFIFLENVPAIRSRGALRIVSEITKLGYDARWCVISAASIGALHRRERWFLLAYAKHNGSLATEKRRGTEAPIHDNEKGKDKTKQSKRSSSPSMLASKSLANTRLICQRCLQEPGKEERISFHDSRCCRFWEIEPDVGRVADGIPQRMDRIRALGNAVVPQQAKEAFKVLMGIK